MDLPKHRGRRPHNALSAAFVRSAKPGYYCDGNGLYLRVDRSGARRWEQRLRIQGRPRTMGLGGYQLVSLAEAREKAFMNRKIARSGGDPRTERHKIRDMPTFAEAAARVLEQLRPGWRTAKHAKDWVTSLRVYAFPQLGNRPVGEITTADVLEVLTPIWHDKQVTAPAGAPAHRGGDEVGGGDGASAGQPRWRCARSSARPTARRSPAHARVASRGGRGRDRGGPDFGVDPHDKAPPSSSWC